MSANADRGLKNVEFLRFVLIWAVVLFHICGWEMPNQYGIDYFEKYFAQGGAAVEMFFLMAGFFLFLKPNYAQDTFDFIKKKWIRLAPLIIFTTLLYYISQGFGVWGSDKSGNFLTMLLVNYWSRDGWGSGSFGSAWFACDLFLVLIVYFYLGKTLEKKYLNIAIAAFALISLVVLTQKIPLIILHASTAFLYMGIGYFIADLYNKRAALFYTHTHTHTHTHTRFAFRKFY